MLLISHEATRTGAPRVAAQVARSLRAGGDHVTVVVRWDGPLAGELADAADELRLETLRHLRALVRFRLRWSRLSNRLDRWIARLVIRRERPDVVYVNTVKSAGYVRPALDLGLPVILHVHELEPLASETLHRYDLDDRYGDVVLVACSHAVAANLERFTGVKAADMVIAPSTIDPDGVRTRAEVVGDARSSNAAGATVGACGTADVRKGIDLWLDVARKVRTDRPDLDARFVWIGAHDTYEQRPDPGIGVEFLGEVDNPLPEIAALDVFTLPSRADAFPLAVLEAMALERPIVAFDAGGAREQLDDTGVLVPLPDVDAFAEAVIGLLDDAGARRELGASARRRVDREFGPASLRASLDEALARCDRARREPEDVVVLHAFEPAALDAAAVDGKLPYRMDELAEHGIALDVPRAVERGPWSSAPVRAIVGPLERIGVPFLQTALAARSIRDADAVVAMFESQANALAVLRRFPLRRLRQPRFVVITCWLTNELLHASPGRRRIYRWAYRSIDAVLVLSENQQAPLASALGLPESKVRAVAFGIDTEYFRPQPDREERDLVVAVGRDSGRDWKTFLDAVRDTDFDVVVATRPRMLDGIDVPRNVTVAGYVDRDEYRELLARASVVAVITQDLVYPTGQSVLLEAMAMGKCCVVTGTAALSEYVRNGTDAVVVGVGDVSGTRRALADACADPEARRRIGAEASRQVDARFSARAMWASIAEIVHDERVDHA